MFKRVTSSLRIGAGTWQPLESTLSENGTPLVCIQRWRKRRWAPLAPTKLFRVTERHVGDPDEKKDLMMRYPQYRTTLRSIRYVNSVNSKMWSGTSDYHKLHNITKILDAGSLPICPDKWATKLIWAVDFVLLRFIHTIWLRRHATFSYWCHLLMYREINSCTHY